MRRTTTIAALLVAASSAWTSIGASAHEGQPALTAEGCVQSVTNLQVDAAAVRDLVPARFTLSREAVGKAAVGYRVYRCPQMTVGGEARSEVIWSEIGVRIMAPDGRLPDHVDGHVVDGHDYYMLSFNTSDPTLAHAMDGFGLPIHLVPGMTFDLALGQLGGTAATRETVPGEGDYTVTMQALTPESPRTPAFEIRGWHLSDHGLAVYREVRSDVTGRPSVIDVHADAGTLLARILGQTDVRTYDMVVGFSIEAMVEIIEQPVGDTAVVNTGRGER